MRSTKVDMFSQRGFDERDTESSQKLPRKTMTSTENRLKTEK